MADLTRFKQVLINLLSNGVKYNVPNGSVSVDWSETDDGMVRFTVSDTGPGIPKAKQDLLFQPFQRLGKEASTIEGTGIGLSICRELMHRMNGRVGFSSEEGKGSRFWADFPQAGRPDGEATAELTESAVADLVAAEGMEIDGEKTILYIEDNPANLQLMSRVFRDVPAIRLVTAPDAEAGLRAATDHLPDLIMMDIHLPGMSGLEALGVLRQTEATRSIPVIAVTAAAMAESRAAGLQAGFCDYITKPFDILNVVRTVMRLLHSG
jgi:CheY-like chemotaxis protein